MLKTKSFFYMHWRRALSACAKMNNKHLSEFSIRHTWCLPSRTIIVVCMHVSFCATILFWKALQKSSLYFRHISGFLTSSINSISPPYCIQLLHYALLLQYYSAVVFVIHAARVIYWSMKWKLVECIVYIAIWMLLRWWW